MATSNPAFSSRMIASYPQAYGQSTSAVMTVQGTFGKTCGLLAILSATAIWSWSAMRQGQIEIPLIIGAWVAALVFMLITLFKPNLAPWTAPLYSAFEGVVLGSSAYLIEHLGIRGAYPGIAIQAVSLTCGTLLCMLIAYMTGLIRVTDRLRMGVVAAVGAISLVYVTALVLGLFGVAVPFLSEGTPLGIAFSVVVVGVAAFNLLLNFDSIEQLSRSYAPKYMEWYGAFGLMVALVWLYLEILRLLSKLNDRR